MKQKTRLAQTFMLCLLLLGAVSSCKQGEGDRCQVNNDCVEGLKCIFASTNSDRPATNEERLIGGICERLVDAGAQDAAVDMGQDMGQDMGPDADMGSDT